MQRSVSLVLLPLAERSGALTLSPLPRFYDGAGLIAAVFATALALNLWVPRFYCRFVCPLGALLGLLGRFALWRIGRTGEGCTGCLQCERNCEGACRPTGRIQISECVMCVNCLDDCAHGAIAYRTRPSSEGESLLPDLRRRGFLLSAATGLRRRADAAAGRRHRAELEPGSHPAARRARGGGLPGALHQVRPVHARLPDQRDPARRPRERAGGRCGRRG